MTKSPKIETLVPDINKVLTDGADISHLMEGEAKNLAEILKYRLSPETRTDLGPGLRMSNLGTKCLRKLWYNVNKPEKAEPLEGHTRLKFLYGDILEWLVLLLAKAAGHKVEGQQTTLKIGDIEGHRDAIIDGTLVDVKSASKYGFNKFKTNTVPENDSFGYMDQIGAYHYASKDEVENKDEAAFLAVEKESGHLVLDTYRMDTTRDWETEVRLKQEVVRGTDIPARGYSPVPHNKSGNMALPTECSYCPFKHECYPGLRTFLYANKPIYMTTVVKEPDVPELR